MVFIIVVFAVVALIVSFVLTFTVMRRISREFTLHRRNHRLATLLKEERDRNVASVNSSMPDIRKTDIYRRLHSVIYDEHGGERFGEKDWLELISKTDEAYGGFSQRLQSVHPLSEFEMKVCVLLKLGISPKHISQLTYHDISSVSSARSRLYQKFFGEKGSAKAWDAYISKF